MCVTQKLSRLPNQRIKIRPAYFAENLKLGFKWRIWPFLSSPSCAEMKSAVWKFHKRQNPVLVNFRVLKQYLKRGTCKRLLQLTLNETGSEDFIPRGDSQTHKILCKFTESASGPLKFSFAPLCFVLTFFALNSIFLKLKKQLLQTSYIESKLNGVLWTL